MGSGFSKMKKQARQFEGQMEQMRAAMQKVQAIGTAGGGLVSLTLNGAKEMIQIEIKPDCVDKNDVEGLQDLIKAAHADACSKLEQQSPMSNLL
ncbi:MAG: YbaB/EbfC family nucleoid-associated protein [Verrucomicrobia bacterium]|nr:YbaB/EbfC family nucleoid-associated protein [Verrucomicrobiota bacterium]